MTKRTIFPAFLIALALSAGAGARAASASVYRVISVFYQSGSNVVSTFGVVAEDLVGNNPPVFFGSIYVATQSGTDQGAGPLQVTLDPLANAGKLTGTVQGNSGPLSVDIAFFGSTISTTQPPLAYVDVSPAPAISIGLSAQRFGHGIGTATSAFGSVNVANAGGYGAHGLGVFAP